MVECDMDTTSGLDSELTCELCKQLLKRAAKLQCCGAAACRQCAVKNVTKSRLCWRADCAAILNTEDILNDEYLRSRVEEWNDPGTVLKCTVCGETCKRAAVLSCCFAQCCRNCGQKKVTQDRKCWTLDCAKENLVTDDLINDDLLREAVAFFKDNSKVNPEHYKEIWQRIQEKKEERKAAADAAANEALGNMSDLSESEGIVGSPPVRLDPTVRQGNNYFAHLRARALGLGINTTKTVAELRERLLKLAKPKEEQELLEFLPKHLLIECEGDGACLFNGIDGLITGEFKGDRMRKICLDFYKKDPLKHRKYLDLNHDASECPGLSNICQGRGQTHAGKILKTLIEPCNVMVYTEKEYIEEMSKPSTFGTNFEMNLLAEKLKMDLMIITKNETGRGKPLFYNHYRPSIKSEIQLNQLVLYSQDLHFEPVVIEMDEYDDGDIKSEGDEDDIEDVVEEVEKEEEPVYQKLKQQKGKKGKNKKKGKQGISMKESTLEDKEYDERRKGVIAMLNVPKGVPKASTDKKGNVIDNPNIAPLGPRKSFGGKANDLEAVTLLIPKGVPKATKDKKGNVTVNPNIAPLGPRKSFGGNSNDSEEGTLLIPKGVPKATKDKKGNVTENPNIAPLGPRKSFGGKANDLEAVTLIPKGVPKAIKDKKGIVTENPNIAPLGPRKSFGGKANDLETVGLLIPKGVPKATKDKKGNNIENPNVAPLGARKSTSPGDISIMNLWKRNQELPNKGSGSKWNGVAKEKQYDEEGVGEEENMNGTGGTNECKDNDESGHWNPKGPNGKIRICFTCESKMHLDPDCTFNNEKNDKYEMGKLVKCGTCYSEWHMTFKCPRKRQKNPIVDGKVGRCETCDSIFHLKLDCPHSEQQNNVEDDNECADKDDEECDLNQDSGYENSRDLLRSKFESCDLRNKLGKTDLRNKLSREENYPGTSRDVDARGGSFQSRRNSGNENRYSRSSSTSKEDHIEKLNPKKDGKVLTCFICDSETHFDNHCPHKKEVFNLRNPRGLKCKICSSNMHVGTDCPHNAYESKIFECAMCTSKMHDVGICPHKGMLREKFGKNSRNDHFKGSSPGKEMSTFKVDSNVKSNPLSCEGKVQTCIICQSKLHLAMKCSHTRDSKKNPYGMICLTCDSVMHMKDDCRPDGGRTSRSSYGSERSGHSRNEGIHDFKSHRKSVDDDQSIAQGVKDIRMEIDKQKTPANQPRGRRWDAQSWDYNVPLKQEPNMEERHSSDMDQRFHENQIQWQDDSSDQTSNKSWKRNMEKGKYASDRHQQWNNGQDGHSSDPWKMNMEEGRFSSDRHQEWDDSERFVRCLDKSNSSFSDNQPPVDSRRSRVSKSSIRNESRLSNNSWDNQGQPYVKDERNDETEQRLVRKVNDWNEEERNIQKVESISEKNLFPSVGREQRHIRMLQEEESPFSAFPPNAFYSNFPNHQVAFPVPPPSVMEGNKPFQLNQYHPPPLPSNPPPLPLNLPSILPYLTLPLSSESPLPGQPPLPKYPPKVQAVSTNQSSTFSANLPLSLQSAQPPPPPLPVGPPKTNLSALSSSKGVPSPVPPPKPAYLRTRKPASIKIMLNTYSVKPAEPTPTPSQETKQPPRPVSPPETISTPGSPYVKSGREKQINPKSKNDKQIDPKKRKHHISGESSQGSIKKEIKEEMDEHLYSYKQMDPKKRKRHISGESSQGSIKSEIKVEMDENLHSDIFSLKEIQDDLYNSVGDDNKKKPSSSGGKHVETSEELDNSISSWFQNTKHIVVTSEGTSPSKNVIGRNERRGSLDDLEKQKRKIEENLKRLEKENLKQLEENKVIDQDEVVEVVEESSSDENEKVSISRDPRIKPIKHEKNYSEVIKEKSEPSRDPRRQKRDRDSKEERKVRIIKEERLPSGMEAVKDRGNTHSKRWSVTRLGKYHELKFKQSRQEEAMNTAYENTFHELAKRTEANKKAINGKIMKLTRIKSDVLVRNKNKKVPKEKKQKKRQDTSSSSSSDSDEKVKDSLKRTEKMVVDDAFASTMEIVFSERVMKILKKREEKFREELTNRFEVRKQKEERSMNQELDRLKKSFKDKDLDHSNQCLKAVKKLETHEEEMSLLAAKKHQTSKDQKQLDKVQQEIRRRDDDEYRSDLARENSLRRSCAAQDWDY